jgi:Zn-dependent protease with chaperone function
MLRGAARLAAPTGTDMPLLLLLLLFLLYLQENWPAPYFALNWEQAILTTFAAQAACVLVAGAFSLYCRHLLHRAPYARSQILQTFTRGRFVLFLLQTGVFVGSLYLLGWGWALKQSIGGVWVPLLKPAMLTPYLGGLILSWFFYYETDRAAHDLLWYLEERPFHNRANYILLHVRHNLLLVVPPLLLMSIQETLRVIFPEIADSTESPLLQLSVVAGILAFAIVSAPWILRVFLGLKPLPEGELRDHLAATARRLNFRFSEILVWNTRGTQANALVTGMFPFHRYIVLSDRLIRDLSTDEIEAVFGHEVGHIKHHHLPFYTFFLLLSMAVLATGFHFASNWIQSHLEAWRPDLAKLFDHPEWFLGLMAAYMFLGFGYLSRRCERQADLFGCRVASRLAFISALEKVADVNGISRRRPGWLSAWQHGTIAERVDFLRGLEERPELERTFQTRFGLLKWGLTLTLLVIVAFIIQTQQWDWLKYL